MDTLKYLDTEAANAEIVRLFFDDQLETVLDIIECDGFEQEYIETAVISGFSDVADALIDELDDAELLRLLAAQPSLLDMEPGRGGDTIRSMIHSCLRQIWSSLSEKTIETVLEPRVIEIINERHPGVLTGRGLKV